jgi:hypothetical protein
MADQDLQPILDAAQNQLSLTFSASDSLDGKALAILGFDVAIGIFTLQSELDNSLWLLVPLFVLLACSILLSLFIVLPRDYVGALVDLDAHAEYFEFGKQELISQLLADTEEAILRNNQKNSKKTRYSISAIFISLAVTGLVAGCII